MSPKKHSASPLRLVILSGSTGRTCDEVVRAAQAQFDDPAIEIVRKTQVRTARAAVAAVKDAAEQNAVVCYSLVAPKIRAAAVQEIERRRVPAVDILGPVLSLLEDHLGQAPRLRPGLSYQLHQERFDRADAVDFTLAHDDGCGLADLHKADVVLVGVSRSAKSVTCFYLAYRGIRAANVPLIPGCALPDELLALPSRKVIGLTMNAKRLRSVRESRVRDIRDASFGSYADVREIDRELKYAQAVMAKHRWRRIDVSYASVEEVAKDIMQMIAE
jgi:regulator of PEP synthase PpsR (kinase-PPPase family)